MNMQAQGSLTKVNGVPYYKISNSEAMPPFFIQIPSSSDMWIFTSSKGGLTAGRKNAGGNLFPYETDDKLHSAYDTGSRVVIKVDGKVWQPFEANGTNKYNITQNIYKSYYGDSLIMEEVNHDLSMSYSYKYETSEKYGFVKTSTIKNLTTSAKEIEVLDGLMNILPHGVNEGTQATGSTLVDAYKAAEICDNSLALYSLTTTINDSPNPIEVMKANIAYTTLENADVYLSNDIIPAFVNGDISNVGKDAYGKKSAYFVVYKATLTDEKTYSFILDTGYDHSMVAEIEKVLAKKDFADLYVDIKQGTEALINIVKNADGVQETADEVACSHHFLNTLYNVMRGGTFETDYDFDYNSFITFISTRNKNALTKTDLLKEIEACKTVTELKEVASKDTDLYRLALEYMPLSFSRRHGDPARPWNRFNINLKDENGEKISYYEGNWRDIYQNWEALGLSYPCYYENMVSKFVNASTADGFNPYRINTQGIDWEKPEPENPFAGLGYWGDHQIIYLLRLLKGLKNHFPQKLDEMLNLDIFSYANVPYAISTYEEILKNSKDTIYFDFDKDAKIEELEKEFGTDAKLILNDGKVYTANLTEKLLVPLLSKVSNLLVGGGIWMNTQRPEWNDANNAIVGIGLSVVTTYHVKSYIEFMKTVFANKSETYKVTDKVVTWLVKTCDSLVKFAGNYAGNEKALLDEMGYAFSDYRTDLYANGLNAKTELTSADIMKYLDAAEKAVDYTIEKNKGDVYTTYNLLKDDFSVEAMRPMLEGQSAIVGSGSLDANTVDNLLSSMKADLFSEKLRCHTLYPVRMTKRFADKNCISLNIEPINGVVTKDINGKLHFAGDIQTAVTLKEKMDKACVSTDTQEALLNEFENLFSHKKFNGRSEVMYKFEGIGCVYWHQNAKLALAVLESVQREKAINEANAANLYKSYRELMSGFIYRKSPSECLAIPVEPYSHTSFAGKSEQPGMTGQVKESVIIRRIELGVTVDNGEISFDNWFVADSEYNAEGKLNFSIYSIPVSYTLADTNCVTVVYKSGETKEFANMTIDTETSLQIFERSENIEKIEVTFAK